MKTTGYVMFGRMALVYADEIRKELKALERRIKDLRWKHHRFLKEEMHVRHSHDRIGLGDPRHFDLATHEKRVALITEAKKVAAEMHQQEGIQRVLQLRLETAPKRPRPRSHNASIAASGSKAFNATLKNGKAVKDAWNDAMIAASETAGKYALSSVPNDAKAIIRKRVMKRHPKLRSEILRLR
jgi:hypothetical protein